MGKTTLYDLIEETYRHSGLPGGSDSKESACNTGDLFKRNLYEENTVLKKSTVSKK